MKKISVQKGGEKREFGRENHNLVEKAINLSRNTDLGCENLSSLEAQSLNINLMFGFTQSTLRWLDADLDTRPWKPRLLRAARAYLSDFTWPKLKRLTKDRRCVARRTYCFNDKQAEKMEFKWICFYHTKAASTRWSAEGSFHVITPNTFFKIKITTEYTDHPTDQEPITITRILSPQRCWIQRKWPGVANTHGLMVVVLQCRYETNISDALLITHSEV